MNQERLDQELRNAAARGVGVEILLKSNANVNSQDAAGWSALHYASNQGHLSLVELLLNSNANINLQDGETPLHQASYWGRAALVAVLLARNADPTIKSKDGRTARDGAVPRKDDVKLFDDFLPISSKYVISSNPSYRGKAVGEWSVEDAQAWVSSLGTVFVKYSQLFAENGLDGETLLALDKGELTALGVNAGHAAIIIQKLKCRTQVSPPPYQ